MHRRSAPLSVISLLALMLAVTAFVRFVDLHWHQHLNGALTSASGDVVPVTYIADASTPHLANDQDHDVPVYGDEGATQLGVHLPDMPPVIVALLPVFLLLGLVPLPPARHRHPDERTPRLFGSPQLPPPLRGPPR